ncbi:MULTISPECIES: hexose kinase [unclassified Virgibacillus]|uniref:hexose kinase n=1 Tax=unclassified Virgibacillus TaxID=2620237 RepID=UPI0024DDFBF6|nr:hexose kinase [Virgibacillus sp. LDC-1]
MILTVTLNPAVDISYKLETLSLDTVNRVADVTKTAGGKGLNVARVLQQLNVNVAATGFLGGSLGAFIRSELTKLGIEDYFVGIKGETRNCIALIHEGQQTEILEGGPLISEEEQARLLAAFSLHLPEVSLVAISGSLPAGIAADYYEQMLALAAEQDVPVLLDTKGDLLERTLQSVNKPYLIKPNESELSDLLGRTLTTEAALLDGLQDERFEGIPMVVVTRGANGAIVKEGNKLYRVTIPNVTAVNPVGSGDSVVAGFAAGLSKGMKEAPLLKYGMAMGTLNAMEEKTGFIDIEKLDWCMEQIQVIKIGH